MITLNKTEKKGFTLIELLVVIAIIAILAAILFPVFAKAREKSRQTVCTSNQRQLAIAMTMYAQDHEQRLPNSGNWKTSLGGSNGISGKSWECPSASKSGDNSVPVYGYNAWLSDRVTSDIDNPATVLMTADSAGGVDVLNAVTDIDTNRHSSKAVASYVDGHSEAGNSFSLVPSPISRNSMQFWVMADIGVMTDTTGKLTGWKDQSGKGRDMIPHGTAPTLSSSAINGKPGVKFIGNGGMKVDFTAKGITPTSTWTVFCVANSPLATATGHIISVNDAPAGTDYTGSGFYVSPNNVKNWTIAGPGAGLSVYSVSSGSQTCSAYAFAIGMRGGSQCGYDYYTGDIAEEIYFSPQLSSAEVDTVYGYLKKKWGILQ